MNPLNFLTFRNALEQAKRLAGIVRDAPGAPVGSIEASTVITLPADLVRPENAKRYPGERDVGAIDYMVGHVTDVTGGFGVQKWGPDGWKRWGTFLYASEQLPNVGGPLVDLAEAASGLSPAGWGVTAETMALCSRLAQLPYHRITSRKLGECVNRPFAHRTKASGKGNGGIALAMDMGNKEPITAEVAKAGQNMVRRAYLDLVSVGDPNRRIWYTNHSNFAADRRGDTHRIMHLSVVVPAIEALRDDAYNVAIDYERQVGSGRALTTRDDPDAHFDTKGRRIRTPEGTPL